MYLRVNTEKEYLESDISSPTIVYIEESDITRFSPPDGYEIFDSNTELFRSKNGDFYLKK